MKKAPLGTVVYVKKSVICRLDLKETPQVITDLVTNRSGNVKALLSSGEKRNFGELTDVPCSRMGCDNCKWHRRKP